MDEYEDALEIGLAVLAFCVAIKLLFLYGKELSEIFRDLQVLCRGSRFLRG